MYNAHVRDPNLLPTYDHDTWSHSHCKLACPCQFPDAQVDVPIGIEVDEDEDYTSMDQTCLTNHMRLCSSSEICEWLSTPGNEFEDKWKIQHDEEDVEIWVPVDDAQDNWICTSLSGCDSGNINRCDTPLGMEPAMVANLTKRSRSAVGCRMAITFDPRG